jgi:hypothetical protein
MPKFTRQHYLKIGGMLRRAKAPKSEIDAYCRMFKRDNPLFDEKRFRDYVVGKRKK